MMVELVSVMVIVDGNVWVIWDVLMDFGYFEWLVFIIDSVILIGEGEGVVCIVKLFCGLEIYEKFVVCDIGDYWFCYLILDSGDMLFVGVVSYYCMVLLSLFLDFCIEIFWCSEGEVDGLIVLIRVFFEFLY